MRKTAFMLAATMVITFWATGAYACKGEEAVFEDSFDELDGSWGQASEVMSVEDGHLQLALNKAGVTWAISHFSPYDDADICVTTTNVKGPADMVAQGIIFWFADYDNCYWFAVSPAGTWALFRLMKNKWINVANWTENPAINKGQGAVNELRVLTQGKTATLFANGKQLGKFKGIPPKDSQFVGLAIEQFDDSQPVTVTFDDFVVATPAASQ